jgi:hypothetical protein
VQQSPATKIPDDIAGGRCYRGHDLSRAGMGPIWSVGKTSRLAVRALGRAMWWGKIADFEVMEGGDTAYTWGLRFTVDGTGMKAAGIHVPGGAICTWWK